MNRRSNGHGFLEEQKLPEPIPPETKCRLLTGHDRRPRKVLLVRVLEAGGRGSRPRRHSCLRKVEEVAARKDFDDGPNHPFSRPPEIDVASQRGADDGLVEVIDQQAVAHDADATVVTAAHAAVSVVD